MFKKQDFKHGARREKQEDFAFMEHEVYCIIMSTAYNRAKYRA